MTKLMDRKLKDSDFIFLTYEDFEQYLKWGRQEHTTFEWLAYITEELGELSEAMSEYEYRNGDPETIVNEAVQVATLALKVALMADEQLEEKDVTVQQGTREQDAEEV